MKHKYLLFLLGIFCAYQQVNSQEINKKDSLLPIDKKPAVQLGSSLSQIWELDNYTERGTLKLQIYRPNYILPFRLTDKVNKQPTNFNPSRGIPPYKDYQRMETKFQISLKSKIIQDAFWDCDIWVGFTQKSYWQVYNEELSRPFRELNYEPEIMFVAPLNFSIGDFKWRMINLSLNHQSNGKEQTLSRSWNRIILTTAHEWRNFIFITHYWWRFTEDNKEDDNPEITKYVGRAEFNTIYSYKKHLFNLSIRNNLSFTKNRGYAEFSYIFPIKGDLKAMFQASHGFGDSLIEYNHKQTTIGLGVVLMEL
ncbi:phospholipase A [Capnocytophaga canimorsus]|uniref:Phosphatidylcholine 1-acylhydrolase n=1 Tax=Capnocytophaga canimorsus (strain 5) TaxID=860228 RepID=F9YSR0_CAPCC|nr:phospholipase A [Capnocytophaga canimorsus]AEK23905.1 Phosphatidylcholine 1-acylhydrolase [Capnocytophaga canimorsus Cc5]AWL78393.1 phospholipase [Capnocytophaga canimorsus]AYW37017.1 phospholipase [Capnocytophaga canimorsus]MDT9499737.1 phospholipase A [Capnocytophaga canimorsus]CEN50648.1 Phosphatidylcholine 1-acylhydrolase [Capnocytophaga canimorsus]